VKVGDIVKLNGSFGKDRTGMLVSEGNENWSGWWNILDCDGLMVVWPESQLEVINEGG
tara:strand:+ start:707 stop:880 length:174 start_codon:yes stop_codon:yes gene_type:complete